MNLTEEIYLRAPYKSMQEVADTVEVWDATTASWTARCPRYAEAKILYGIRAKEELYFLTAGKALHAAINLYYCGFSVDECMAELGREWGHPADFRPPIGKFEHLHLGHLEVVFKNYLDFAKKHDMFRPLMVERDKLNLSNVIAGVWKVTDTGLVVLGESKFIMEFEVKHPKTGEKIVVIHAGKPDLPIEMGGLQYIFDHKSSSSYLSDYYFKGFKFSNQFRGYCKMVQTLTGIHVQGALVNGIYVGEKASSVEFKGSRFARYGPMAFQPAHLDEALLNQHFWLKTLHYHHEQGYFPQNAPSDACKSCEFSELCAASPMMRETVMRTQYQVNPKSVAETFISL